MKKNYEKLFSALDTPEPPAGLRDQILYRITTRERRILGIKIAFSGVVFSASLLVIVEGMLNVVSSLSQSGFFQIGSLMFSDFSAMAANFPEFALSMIESFPIFTSAIVLGGILFAIWSMAALIDEASLMRTHKFSLLH